MAVLVEHHLSVVNQELRTIRVCSLRMVKMYAIHFVSSFKLHRFSALAGFSKGVFDLKDLDFVVRLMSQPVGSLPVASSIAPVRD